MKVADRRQALCAIMAKVHALAELAWPDETPSKALDAIIDIQIEAADALGLPEGMDLMTGDPAIDL